MQRLIAKFILYFSVFSILSLIGLYKEATLLSILIMAIALGAINTFIRPILLILALPLNMLTFGITSIFVNILTLMIANAISGHAISAGFWIWLVTAGIVMIIEDRIILMRNRQHLARQ